MSKYTPRAEMTAEQSALARRDAKRRRYLAERGTPSRSKDIDAVQRHVRRLYYEGGMTSHAMAAQSGVGRDTIMHLVKGYRVVNGRRVRIACLLQTTIDKLWTLRLQLPPDQGRSGAHLPPSGTRRRLQALNALGYDCVWMADRLGICAGNISALMLGQRGRSYVYAATAQRIAALYDEYQHTDPAAAGRSSWHISTARTRARKNGYAPPWCWDDETIDDPRAEPEWTGACGTAQGYAIHRREQIPICRACREARHGEPEAAAPTVAAALHHGRPHTPGHPVLLGRPRVIRQPAAEVRSRSQAAA
ncbi:hypothetical protein LG634_21970 [Streptomyces bambusae]|uniref:hypothetical protein n=1 Tax=Streptomyces bambusae TaxID=1550616 RepID=UPI001CFF0F14|nr:hypothetical protein [Streptomyces bambusae]MCB5167483.1 hypothetical protein [Streptomyces bambusae]